MSNYYVAHVAMQQQYKLTIVEQELVNITCTSNSIHNVTVYTPLVFPMTHVGCTTNVNRECEDEVDEFLNSYCANLTAIAGLPTASTVDNVITPSQCTQATVTATVTSSCTNSVGGAFQVTIPISSMESGDQSPLTPETNNTPILALGALLALSMVLLAVVTTGWVCTCLIMKKRDSSTCKG